VIIVLASEASSTIIVNLDIIENRSDPKSPRLVQDPRIDLVLLECLACLVNPSTILAVKLVYCTFSPHHYHSHSVANIKTLGTYVASILPNDKLHKQLAVPQAKTDGKNRLDHESPETLPLT
jgi:hypothetical protein